MRWEGGNATQRNAIVTPVSHNTTQQHDLSPFPLMPNNGNGMTARVNNALVNCSFQAAAHGDSYTAAAAAAQHVERG